jgi:hypothetical protein
MNAPIIIPLFSGVIGALIATGVSVYYQRKNFIGTLKEKWICDLRNEVAQLIGMSENLRLLWGDHRQYTGMFDQEIKNLCHQLVGKKQKIHMLLNDNDDQKELFRLINDLVGKADGASATPKQYMDAENNVIKVARELLGNEWHKISKVQWPKTWKVILVFLEILLFAGLVFLEIQRNKGVSPIF